MFFLYVYTLVGMFTGIKKQTEPLSEFPCKQLLKIQGKDFQQQEYINDFI